MQSKEFFCGSRRCRNDRQPARPNGSATVGRVGTDEGSPGSAINPRSTRTPSQPKPSDQREDEAREEVEDLLNMIPNILDAAQATNAQVLATLRHAAEIIRKKKWTDYWMSEAGQQELLQKIDKRNQRPSDNGLSPLDYSEGTKKAMLSSAGVAGHDGGEWIQVELCADTGACDTVMPRSLCGHIPITPSLQSLNFMEYEVADGHTIPNLGERKCLMWTEGAEHERPINLQVADVHKALLSLSRCADMGFESRFGRLAGALIDEESEEVIPLERKGNLYVLKCWIRAAPFGGQERR